MSNISLSLQSSYIIFYVVLALAALVFSWWSYRNLAPLVSPFKRALLLGLRTLGIFLVGLLLLEPLVTHYSQKTIGDKLAVVYDLSSSMKQTDSAKPRYKAAEDILGQTKIANRKIEYFGFSDSVISINKPPDSSQIIGQATDLAKAIIEPVKIVPEQIGAMLLITDGAANIGDDPLATAATSDVPIYSLVVGQSKTFKDIAISNIDYPPVNYSNTEFNIELEINSSGYGGRQAIAEIRDDNKVIASKKVTLPSDGASAKIDFTLSFADEGVRYLQAAVSLLDGEAYKENNVRNFAIKLLKDKINILLLSSGLNWELTYLKRALENDPYFQVQTVLAGMNKLIRANDLPATPEAWRAIDQIIAIDINRNTLGGQYNNLQVAVESGTGFLFIAGQNSSISPLGGWDDLLPVQAKRQSRIVSGEFFPFPEAQPIAKTIAEIDGLDWRKLAPLRYRIDNLELGTNAIILLSCSGDDDVSVPVLIGGRYKSGKTAAITAYPWWPRLFHSQSGNVSSETFVKFYSNLIRWLIAREDIDRFNLASDKPVYKLGEPVNFEASLFDESYNLISDAKISLTISDSAGAAREFQLSPAQPGKYSGVYGSPSTGSYLYNGYAIAGNDTVGHSEGKFIVESFGLEQENPSANFTLMKQIAEATGGQSYTPDDFSRFPDELKLNTKHAEIFKEYRSTGSPLFLIIIILAFVLEWGIRKFSQLP